MLLKAKAWLSEQANTLKTFYELYIFGNEKSIGVAAGVGFVVGAILL